MPAEAPPQQVIEMEGERPEERMVRWHPRDVGRMAAGRVVRFIVVVISDTEVIVMHSMETRRMKTRHAVMRHVEAIAHRGPA
jgi:hypothetical protein